MSDVAIARAAAAGYPAEAPFHPDEAFPECPHAEVASTPNAAYRAVRGALALLGLDAANAGTRDWNPLAGAVRPGDRVLVKPNFVLHENAGGGPLAAVVTHPSVVRAVVDFALVALDGRGEIVVGDAPQANCDWEALARATGLDRLAAWLGPACARRGVRFRLADFRRERAVYRRGVVWERRQLGGREPVAVRLGAESWMEAVDPRSLYGADYDRRATARAHAPGAHVYRVAPELVESDVLVSVPKLKTHSKVGATLNLKNMVGTVVDKNGLAHYRVGPGGDERESAAWDDRVERALTERLLATNARGGRSAFLGWKAVRKTLRGVGVAGPAVATGHGNWHGNDTAWRMALDLDRVARFARADGSLGDEPARRYVSVVDGIVGGDGEGPLAPDAVDARLVLAGLDPLAVDRTAARAMGFDPARIPLVARASEARPDLDVRVLAEFTDWEVAFRPPAGWVGQVGRGRG